MERDNLVENTSTSESNFTAVKKTYFIRWCLLVAVLIENALAQASTTSFGTVNDVMVAYFKVSYEAIDWIFLAHWVTVLLFAPLFAWFSFKDQLGFRNLAVLQCVTVFSSYLSLVLAVVWPEVFALVLIGQFIDGIAFSITHIIPPVFAVHWFPDNQVGTAISVATAGLHLGRVLSFVLPANILQSPPLVTSNVSGNSIYNSSDVGGDWYTHDRENMLWLFGSLLVISVFGFIFMIIYAKDCPPTPPTVAMAVQKSNMNLGFKGIEKTWNNFVTQIKNLFCNCSFLLIITCFGVTHSVSSIETILLGDIVRTIAPRLSISVTSNQLTGFILLMIPVGGILGAAVSGKVVNVNKNYLRQTNVSSLLLGLSNLGFLLAYYFENVPGLFITNVFFGVAVSSCLIPLFEMSTQQTFPIDETFTSIWLVSFFTPAIILVCVISRIIMNNSEGLGVVIVQAAYSWLVFILAFFIKPVNKRLEAEKNYSTTYGSASSS